MGSAKDDSDQRDDEFDQYFINGKRVSKDEWMKLTQSAPLKLNEVLEKLGLETEARQVQALRNELVHNVSTSGITAMLEKAQVEPQVWFSQWARTELPGVIAEGQLKALTIYENQKQKRDNRWSAKIRGSVSEIIIGVIIGVVVGLILAVIAMG